MLRRVLLLIVVLLPGSALAEDPAPDYARTGPYIGVEGAVGVATKAADDVDDLVFITNLAVPIVVSESKVRVDAAFGVNGRIGYRLHPRVAVEGEFEWIDGFTMKMSNDQKFATGDTWFASGNVKGYVLTNRFQPFVLVGAGYLRAKYEVLGMSDTFGGPAMRAGLGFDGYITEHVVITLDAEYVLAFRDADMGGNLIGIDLRGVDLDYVSIGVGLQYRF